MNPDRLALNPALSTPTSTSVSCLLMQDTVEADLLSLDGGSSTIALFANPFLGGKQEALVIDEDGQLTYLRRTVSATGWDQQTLSPAVPASEVVAVVHHANQSVWAICTPAGGGSPLALRLNARIAGGVVVCHWQQEDAIMQRVWQQVKHLSVSYCGQIPVVTGLDVQKRQYFALRAILPVPNPKGGTLYFADSTGTDVMGLPPQDVIGGVSTGAGQPIWFSRRDTQLVRIEGGSTRTAVIAGDTATLVGTFQLAGGAGIGCVYLNNKRELVTWNETSTSPVTVPTPGLGFETAACWTDMDRMIHIYGTDDKGTLKVVHQASWDANGSPVWSRSQVHDAKPPESVVTCIGLEPQVAGFDLDPFPDATPSMLVQRQGAAVPSEQFAISTQDLTSAIWTRERIRLPEGATHLVSHYVSTVTVLDQRGAALPELPVTVSADVQVEVRIDGASYLIGPKHTVALTTDPAGKIVIAAPADSLLPPTLHVDAVGMAEGAHIQAAAAVHDYLAGTGTLASQKTTFDAKGEALANAKDGHGHIVDEADRGACADVSKSCHDVFAVAAGKKITSVSYTGTGPAQALRGFAIGAAFDGGPGRVTRTEFASHKEVQAHLDAIRRLPEYAGIWDDFKKWVGDVWESIRNGLIKVEHAIVDAAERTIHIFVKIGEKIVEGAKLIIDGIVAAARAVEAVIRQIVSAIVRVIDWLKALFNFTDIWNTKLALEEGLHTILDYGNTVSMHYSKKARNWFPQQKKLIHDYFARLETEYYHQPLGNAHNIIPPLPDASGRPTSAQQTCGNPQATWMLDKANSAPARAAAGLAVIDVQALTPITDAWQKLIDAMESSGIAEEFRKALGDFDTLLRRIVNPADPDQANKTVLAALFNVLDDLIDAVLEVLEGVFDALVALMAAVAAGIDDVLGLKLDLGPINALYKWVQPRQPRKEPEELTLGGLVSLIAAFVITIAYKILYGVGEAPFPGGVFPAIPAPALGADEPDQPAMSPDDMRILKLTAGFANIAGAIPAGIADVAPILPGGTINRSSSLIIPALNALCGATFAGLVGATPPVNGKGWSDSAATIGFDIAAYNAACGWATIAGYLANLADSPAFKNVIEVKVGPVITFLVGVGRITCAAMDHPPTEFAKAQIGVSAVPSVSQILRFGITRGDEDEVSEIDDARAWFVAVVDGLCCVLAGIMTVVTAREA